MPMSQTSWSGSSENLTKLRIRDLLNDEEYVRQREELGRQQIGISQKLKILEQHAFRFEPAISD